MHINCLEILEDKTMNETVYTKTVNLNDIRYRDNTNSITGARTERPFAIIIYGNFSEQKAVNLAQSLEQVLNLHTTD